jgi:thymidine phosphorylase
MTTTTTSCSGRHQFNIPTLIAKKRDGKSFTKDEIQFVVSAISGGLMDSAQIGALLMATRLIGMDSDETVHLTRAMTTSGHVLEWPEEWRHLVVDKHSTGGVGDKVSLVLAPALAACGLKVPKVSGRGLSHTGGTLDKLESIPGLSVVMTTDQIRDAVDRVGCCIVGQTSTIVPADGIMYAIRDVTATVDCIPLIAGSIVSKKAAKGLAALVLDVKFGRGALIHDQKQARDLARTLVSVSNKLGVKTTALLTKMDSPLGYTIGNALELAEAVCCMKGQGPESFVNIVSQLGGQLIYNVNEAQTVEEGAAKVRRAIDDGRALAKFHEMIQVQGVSRDVADSLCSHEVDVFTVLPAAKTVTMVTAAASGYISVIDSMVCATVSNALGAGRNRSSDSLDLAVGIRLRRHVGDHVTQGDVVMEIHHNGPLSNELVITLQKALQVQEEPLSERDMNLVYDVITA